MCVCARAHTDACIKGTKRRRNLGRDGLRSGQDISAVFNSLMGGQVHHKVPTAQEKRR